MTWWFKARRGHLLLPLALLVFGAGLYAVQGTTVLLPSLVGSPRVALSLFVPVPLLAFLMAVLESRLPAAEVSGVRSMTRLDNGLVATVMAAAVLCSVLIASVQGSAAATAGGRNAVFLTGLMLLGRAWAGQTAVMVPVGWLLTVVLVGFRGNVPHLWTVIALPADNPYAAAASLAVFAIGLAAQIRSSRKTA
ncbi:MULTISPECIES: hypothetical protein [Streptomyces]|uniref:Uncharacterized protein n=1 Tax=Streptomyces mirabilis TaxID=68239 RepID=A0ABU3UTS1_9ACTN|nr:MULTISPECIES: hypothetical protein [Streptomyces]KPI11752.1 hypothetical protein OK006_4073 [Actinobacteria bacterium OK006]KAF5997188.1 hypothetical protein BOG92_040825 [Streptomyces sp. WAC00263]MCX5349309.1 hypothetical protein [Streptomyces mirabilis]MDU8997312.1 hypothetical protein [Streptomyces mirabilis]NMI58366.1 hypothetical protein [Streptomyces sp. RLA2-12]